MFTAKSSLFMRRNISRTSRLKATHTVWGDGETEEYCQNLSRVSLVSLMHLISEFVSVAGSERFTGGVVTFIGGSQPRCV